MKILVAGVGNIFHGDDAFGVEVAGALTKRRLPPEARVVDFGIRSFDLAYALLDGYDVTVLVDATSRGGAPGTLYTIEIDPEAAAVGEMDPHGMNPMRVLEMARAMGECKGRILLVGCQPETLGPDEGQMGLSRTVAAAIEPAADIVERLVRKVLE
jgi:hydrogenase maturation protease